MGYIIGVSLFGFLFMVLGVVLLQQSSPIIGVLLTVVGFVVTYAGMAGTLFKVIADGVAKGNENAETGTVAQKVSDSGGSTAKTATKVQGD